jgi:hypothetical protein
VHALLKLPSRYLYILIQGIALHCLLLVSLPQTSASFSLPAIREIDEDDLNTSQSPLLWRQETLPLIEEATRLSQQGTEESLRRAINIWKQVSDIYTNHLNQLSITSTDVGLQLAFLNYDAQLAIGRAFYDLKDYQEALNYLLPIAKDFGILRNELDGLRDQDTQLWMSIESLFFRIEF